MKNSIYFNQLITSIEGKSTDELRLELRQQNVTLDMILNEPVTIIGAAEEGIRLLNILVSLNAKDVCIVDGNENKVGSKVAQFQHVLPFSREHVENKHIILATHRTYKAYTACKSFNATTVTTFMHIQTLYPEVFEPHFFHENMLEVLLENTQELINLQKQFSDDLSIGVLASCIDYRLNGNPTVLGSYIDWELYLPTGIDLNHYSHTYVDCGSFDGDSVNLHISRYGTSIKKVFAFEPDPSTFKRLEENMSNYNFVSCINKGVGDKVCKLNFSANKDRASLFSEAGELSIDITSLDNELLGEAPSFIKMNIEAFEPQALEGAKHIIKTHHPLLAISAYHKPEHIFSLVAQINSISPNQYKYYLRQHDGGLIETVLYAIPKIQKTEGIVSEFS